MARNVLRGYVRGRAAAARYCGIAVKAFRRWCEDPEIEGRDLLTPRIIRGEAYYSIQKLDKFMDPSLNAPGAEIASEISAHNH